MPKYAFPSFAKINLRLDILGKRADGYHELRTIFRPCRSMMNCACAPAKSSEISLTIHGNNELAREPVEKKSAYRAVEALRGELRFTGVELELHKTIPSAVVGWRVQQRGSGRCLGTCN